MCIHQESYLPTIVYDNSHSCSRRQSGQVQIHMFDAWWHFAHTKELVQ